MIRHNIFKSVVSSMILLAFLFTSLIDPQYVHASNLTLPPVGTLLTTTSNFSPVIVRGLSVYADDPMKFDFIIDTGTEVNVNLDRIRDEADKQIKYFLAALTIPTKDQWVNLSPYENNRIVEDNFGVTEMGKDLLAQDYILKQLMASLSNPEDKLGKDFWEAVYSKWYMAYGEKQNGQTTYQIPPTNDLIQTFNKVWITPDKASVYEHGNHVFVLKKHLKVMLEEDYMAMQYGHENVSSQLSSQRKLGPSDLQDGLDSQDAGSRIKSGMTEHAKEIIREILIPELEREVNEGEHFAILRQVYNSMILATWFKMRLKQSILGQAYVDQKVTEGINDVQRSSIDQIYQQYLDAYKIGVYDLIKEDYDPATQQIIPKKYFSGGIHAVDEAMLEIEDNPAMRDEVANWGAVGSNLIAEVKFDAPNMPANMAMLTSKKKFNRNTLIAAILLLLGVAYYLFQPKFGQPDAEFYRSRMPEVYAENQRVLSDTTVPWVGYPIGQVLDGFERSEYNDRPQDMLDVWRNYKNFYQYAGSASTVMAEYLPPDGATEEFFQRLTAMQKESGGAVVLTDHMGIFGTRDNGLENIAPKFPLSYVTSGGLDTLVQGARQTGQMWSSAMNRQGVPARLGRVKLGNEIFYYMPGFGAIHINNEYDFSDDFKLTEEQAKQYILRYFTAFTDGAPGIIPSLGVGQFGYFDMRDPGQDALVDKQIRFLKDLKARDTTNVIKHLSVNWYPWKLDPLLGNARVPKYGRSAKYDKETIIESYKNDILFQMRSVKESGWDVMDIDEIGESTWGDLDFQRFVLEEWVFPALKRAIEEQKKHPEQYAKIGRIIVQQAFTEQWKIEQINEEENTGHFEVDENGNILARPVALATDEFFRFLNRKKNVSGGFEAVPWNKDDKAKGLKQWQNKEEYWDKLRVLAQLWKDNHKFLEHKAFEGYDLSPAAIEYYNKLSSKYYSVSLQGGVRLNVPVEEWPNFLKEHHAEILEAAQFGANGKLKYLLFINGPYLDTDVEVLNVGTNTVHRLKADGTVDLTNIVYEMEPLFGGERISVPFFNGKTKQTIKTKLFRKKYTSTGTTAEIIGLDEKSIVNFQVFKEPGRLDNGKVYSRKVIIGYLTQPNRMVYPGVDGKQGEEIIFWDGLGNILTSETSTNTWMRATRSINTFDISEQFKTMVPEFDSIPWQYVVVTTSRYTDPAKSDDIQYYLVNKVTNRVYGVFKRPVQDKGRNNVYVLELDLKEAVPGIEVEKTVVMQATLKGTRFDVDMMDKVVTTTELGSVENVIAHLQKIMPEQKDMVDRYSEDIMQLVRQAERNIYFSEQGDPSREIKMNFVIDEVRNLKGGRDIVIRIKEDQLRRPVIQLSGEKMTDIAVAYDFFGQSVLKSRIFTPLGLPFEIDVPLDQAPKADSNGFVMEQDKLVSRFSADQVLDRLGVTGDLRNTLKSDSRIGLLKGKDYRFVKRYMIVNGERIPAGEGFVEERDAYGRFLASQSNGVITFQKVLTNPEDMKKVPLGMSAGDVSYDVKTGERVRETEWTKRIVQDSVLGKAHVYSVIYENRGGETLNQEVEIQVYYETGLIAEYYPKDGYKLYSRNGMPLFANKVVHGKEYEYSSFKYYRDGNRFLMDEELHPEVAASASAREGTLSLLYENGQFLAMRKVERMFASVEKPFVDLTPYQQSVAEKVSNSFLGNIGQMIFGSPYKNFEKQMADLKQEKNKVSLQSIKNPAQGVYIDRLRDIEQKAAAILASIFLVWSLLLKSAVTVARMQYRRRAGRNLNLMTIKQMKDVFGDDGLALKISELRETKGPLVLGNMIPAKDNESFDQYLDQQLEAYGIRDAGQRRILKDLIANKDVKLPKAKKVKPPKTADEKELQEATEKMRLLEESVKQAKVSIFDLDVDPRTMPDVPAIGRETIISNIVSAVDQGFGAALVIQRLKKDGFITDEDIQDAYGRIFLTDETMKESYHALVWTRLKANLLTKAQNDVLKQIRQGNFTNLDKLPDTPEADVLRTIVGQNILGDKTRQTLQRLAQDIYLKRDRSEKDYDVSFAYFVTQLVKDQIVRPIFDNAVEKTGIPITYDADREAALMTVFYRTHRAIFANPKLLEQFAQPKNGIVDIKHNPGPLHIAMEPISIWETTIYTLLQMNPSQTKGTTFGGANLMVTALIYVTRQAKKAVEAGLKSDEIGEMVKIYSSTIREIMIHERERLDTVNKRTPFEVVSERAPGRPQRMIDILGDEKMMTLFEMLIRDDKSLYDVLIGNEPLFEGQTETVRTKILAEKSESGATFNVGKQKVQAANDRELWQHLRKMLDENIQTRAASFKENDPSKKGPMIGKITANYLNTGFDDFLKNVSALSNELLGEQNPESMEEDNRTKDLHKDIIWKIGKTPWNITQSAKEWQEFLMKSVSPKVTMLYFGAFALKAFGFTALFATISPIATWFFIGMAVISVLKMLLSPTGRGVKRVYWNRVFKPYFNYEKFYGVEKGWKWYAATFLGKVIPAAIMAVTIAEIIAKLAGYEWALQVPLALRTFIASSMFFAAPMTFGKSTNTRQKVFWMAIFVGASFLNFWLMPHHLFPGGMSSITASSHTLITFYLWMLTVIPTYLSVYQLASSFRSTKLARSELWSNVANKAKGMRSVMPMWAWALFGLGIAVKVGASIAGYPIDFLPSGPWAWAGIGVGLSFMTSLPRIASSALSWMTQGHWNPENSYWERRNRRSIQEAIDLQSRKKGLVPGNETVESYFLRLITELEKKDWLDFEEAAAWKEALKDPKNLKSRFAHPRSEKAQQILFDAFQALHNKKPLTDVMTLLEASSTHTHAFGEKFSFTATSAFFKGTFNQNPKTKKDTTLLGYVARTQKEHWNNLVKNLAHYREDIGSNEEFMKWLKNLDENAEANDLFMRDFGLTEEQKDFVYKKIQTFLNEQRPNNRAVANSSGQDILEYHLFFAAEHGDFEYSQAIKQISSEYAFRSLNEEFERLKKKPAKELKDHERIFVQRFEDYHGFVSMKLRSILHENFLWAMNKFSPDKRIVSLKDVEDFKGKLRSLKGDVDKLENGPEKDALLAEITEILNRKSLDRYSAQVTAGEFSKWLIDPGAILAELKKQAYLTDDGKFHQAAWNEVRSASDLNLDKKYEHLRNDIFRLLQSIYAQAPDSSKAEVKIENLETLGPNINGLMKVLKEKKYLDDNGLIDKKVFGSVGGFQDLDLPSGYAAHAENIYNVLKVRYEAPDVFEWSGLFEEEQRQKPFQVIEVLNRLGDALKNNSEAMGKVKGMIPAWDMVEHVADYVGTMIRNDVQMSLWDSTQDVVIFATKNGGIATNLWLFANNTVNYDAHVRTVLGQNIWRTTWVSKMAHTPTLAVVNPAMRIWSSTGWTWPVTNVYAISQETFTGDVQRGRRGYITFYGKGSGRTHLIVNLYMPPGEDTAGFLLAQKSQPMYLSDHIDWYMMEWGRPSLYAESLIATEMRYSFNASRLLLDGGQFSVMYNKDLGFDKKISHQAFFWHYLVGPIASLMLLTFPALVPFSAMAYLTPYLFFFFTSNFLMQAINFNNFTRHWRTTENVWLALGRTLKDIKNSFGFYVTLLGNFTMGVVLAANEIFQFYSTKKESLLGVPAVSEIERFEQELFKAGPFLREGFPLKSMIGLIGLLNVVIAFSTMHWIGAILVIPYGYAALVMLTGTDPFRAFSDKKGHLYGKNLWNLITYLPLRGGQGLQSFWKITNRWMMLNYGVSPYAWGLKLKAKFGWSMPIQTNFWLFTAVAAANIFIAGTFAWPGLAIVLANLLAITILGPVIGGIIGGTKLDKGKMVTFNKGDAEAFLTNYDNARKQVYGLKGVKIDREKRKMIEEKIDRLVQKQDLLPEEATELVKAKEELYGFADAMTDEQIEQFIWYKTHNLAGDGDKMLDAIRKERATADAAMVVGPNDQKKAQADNADLGGITMDSDLLNLERKGSGMTPVIQKLPTVPPKFQSLNHSIIRITPITTAQLLSRLDNASDLPFADPLDDSQNAKDPSPALVLGKNES